MRNLAYLGFTTLAALAFRPLLLAHDGVHPHAPAPPTAHALKSETETKSPIRRLPAPEPGARTTGQGGWTFVAASPGLLPLPAEIRPHLQGAHGTLVVDAERDVVYWGLENVGWVAFSNRLSMSWVVKGDPSFTRGNLHGADLLRREGQLPLVAVADNVEGEVYLSDTSFQHAEKLGRPQGGPYDGLQSFHPTDAAFAGESTVFITDGYGQAWFMPAGVDSFQYRGEFHGGKAISQTPHGITFDGADRSLWVSARPEGQLKRWSIAKEQWLEVQGLPPGSTVCDIELWGDYALAPCLDGPNQSPGPIYVLNLKRRSIVAILRPKEDLGFTEAQHIHDAAWYVVGKGKHQELYVLFTNWNPGGIGAMRLVRKPD